LAANTPEDALILTLDLPPQARATASLRLAEGDARFIEKDRTGARFSGSPLAKKIRQLHGDSATFDFSPYFGAVDLVFVDGSHSYEYAIGDSLTAMKLVRRPSGLILWHDYGHAYWPGVTRALNALHRNGDLTGAMTRVEGTTLVALKVE
jgi:hypothetical protein